MAYWTQQLWMKFKESEHMRLLQINKYFQLFVPRRIVCNWLVDSAVIDGVDGIGLVIHHHIVIEPVTPQDLVRDVRRSNLKNMVVLLIQSGQLSW